VITKLCDDCYNRDDYNNRGDYSNCSDYGDYSNYNRDRRFGYAVVLDLNGKVKSKQIIYFVLLWYWGILQRIRSKKK